jgi:hypothetical protein
MTRQHLDLNDFGIGGQWILLYAEAGGEMIWREEAHHVKDAVVARLPAVNRNCCLEMLVGGVGGCGLKHPHLSHQGWLAGGSGAWPVIWRGLEILGHLGSDTAAVEAGAPEKIGHIEMEVGGETSTVRPWVA